MYAPFKQEFPETLWEDIFRWVDYLHPMHGRCEARDVCGINVVAGVNRAFEALSRLRVEGWHVALKIPVALPFLCDAWLNFDVYGTDEEDSLGMARVARIVGAMNWLHHHLPEAGDVARAAFTTNIRLLCRNDNSRLWRRVAKQIEYLTKLAPLQEFEYVWAGFFRITAWLSGLTELRVFRFSRATLASVFAGVRHCLTRSEWHGALEDASVLLYRMVALGDNNKTLMRALRMGLIALLRDIWLADPNCDAQSLASHIAASARLPTVLRVICGGSRLEDGMDQAGETSDLPRQIANYEDLLLAICDARDTARTVRQQWKTIMTCTHRIGPHDSEVRACSCGMAFYCSSTCQRMSWPTHREECTRNDPWGTDGNLNLTDAVYLCTSARLFINKHQDDINAACRALATRAEPVMLATLTLNFTYDGLPPYELDIAKEQPPEEERVVYVWLKFLVGGQQYVRCLPWSISLPGP